MTIDLSGLPREKAVKKIDLSGLPKVEKQAKIDLSQLPKEPVSAPQQSLLQTGQNMLFQAGIGLGNAALLNFFEWAKKKEFEGLASNVPVERVARGVGTAVGTAVGLPQKVFIKGGMLALKGASKVIPKLAKQAGQGSQIAAKMIEGVGGVAAMDALDPTRTVEERVKEIPQTIAMGVITGGTMYAMPKIVQGMMAKATKAKKAQGLQNKANFAYTMAAPRQEAFNAINQNIAQETGVGFHGQQKSIASIVSKVIRKDNPLYDVETMKDHVRGTFDIRTFNDVPKILEKLKKEFPRVSGEVHIDKPLNKFGYRGISVSMPMGNGINGEIQFHTPESMAAKNISDEIYRKWRPYEASGRIDIPENLRKAYLQDMKTSRRLWSGVWRNVTQEEKDLISSSVKSRESVISPSVPSKGIQAPSLNIVGQYPGASKFRTTPFSVTEKPNLSSIVLPSKKTIAQGTDVVKGSRFFEMVNTLEREKYKIADQFEKNIGAQIYNNKVAPVQVDQVGKVIAGESPIVPSMNKIIPESIADDLDESATALLIAKRGIRSWETQRTAAGLKTVTPEHFEALGPGAVLNVEDQRAMMDWIVKNGAELSKTPEGAAKIKDYVIKLNSTISEGARAQQALRDPIKAYSADIIKKNRDWIANIPEEDKAAFDRLFKNMKTPGFFEKMLDWTIEGRSASLLTAPLTHVKNVLGNTVTLVYSPFKSTVAGQVSKIESMISGKPQTRFSQEGFAEVVGTVRGMRSGMRNAFRALVDENYVSDARLLETSRRGGKIPGLTGKIIRTPFRMLAASDEFFKSLTHSANFYQTATRKALQESSRKGSTLTTKKAISDRIAELVKNPTDDMFVKASKAGQEATYQDPLGMWQYLAKAAAKYPMIKLVQPFIKTPVNVFLWGYRRGPMGIASPKNWADMVSKDAGVRADAMARITLGQMIATGVYLEALQGNITGRVSTNKTVREGMMTTHGIQPYSVKIGDRWYSYRGLEPVASWLALMANAAEITKETKKPLSGDKAIEIIFETAKQFKDQPFLQGMEDLLSALDDAEGSGAQAIKNFSTSMIPAGSGLATLARMYDPVIRDPETIPDAIRARIPYLSTKVAPKLDIWGRPITREGSLIDQALLPGFMTTRRPDMVGEELLSLDRFPAKIMKKYGAVDLSNEERNAITEVEGKAIYNMLSKVFSDPQYANLTRDQKADISDKVISTVRKAVRRPFIRKKQMENIKRMPTMEERMAYIEKITHQELIRNK